MRKDAEVALKCLRKSLVIRKKGMAWKGRLGMSSGETGTKETDQGGLDRHLIIMEQYAQCGRTPGKTGATSTYSNLRLHLNSNEDSTLHPT